jgi:D-lactate dehydrogenase (cytochrome)
MLSKSPQSGAESYLHDSSNMAGGHAELVLFPETVQEVAVALARATSNQTPVTVAGAGTGLVGGRVPFGGLVLSTERLNRILQINRNEDGTGYGTAEAGVVLSDYIRAAAQEGLLYPPDPTEWSCFLGGTVATNASGARTFKYGPTRDYVERLEVVLSTGDILDIGRGQFFAEANGHFSLPLAGGHSIEGRLPGYQMPRTRKNASGYYVKPGMDLIDLFIGSEGTLGVITRVETRMLPLPENVFSGLVFFQTEDRLQGFVRAARKALEVTTQFDEQFKIAPRSIEFFDAESLSFLRQKYPMVPTGVAGGIYFEQELAADEDDTVMASWLSLMERFEALQDDSWFASSEIDRARLKEFRHALPVLVNEWLAHHGQRKISTDMALPDDQFAEMMGFYRENLKASGLKFVVFGHIGDNHLHVNILPRNDIEAAAARTLYERFIKRAVELGGTVSAEHGIGKLKRDYLRVLYGDTFLREMASLKRAFDPACILGRGNMFSEDLL